METPTDRSQTPQDEQRSPRAAGDPAICDPGYHVSGPWCSRCGQWFVDGEWRNTPAETTRSPRAAGGFVSGPQPVLIGEKEGPWLSLADHVELARGKTPEHMLDRGPEEERKTFSEVLPIEAVIIDGLTIDGNQFEMGSLQHDVNMGTVSIKFIGVRKLETIYKHMLER